MGLSQRVQFKRLWVDAKKLKAYKNKKVANLSFYFNKEFCPGKPVMVDVYRTLQGKVIIDGM